jgi:acetate kinase
MGTRCGDIDPAILFYLADHGYDMPTLNQLCNKQSGLFGISGQSNDMRTLARLAAQDDRRARLAIDMFCYRVKKYLGAYMAVLGKLHAIVFTGGIGENAVDVREQICHKLGHLGIRVDPQRNQTHVGTPGAISAADSRVAVWVIPTDEEGMIATETYQVVGPE